MPTWNLTNAHEQAALAWLDDESTIDVQKATVVRVQMTDGSRVVSVVVQGPLNLRHLPDATGTTSWKLSKEVVMRLRDLFTGVLEDWPEEEPS